MGGRGAGSGGGGGGGGGTGGISGADIVSTTSLISERERQKTEVDSVLHVLYDIEKEYGVTVSDVQIATLRGRSANSVLAYYDASGNLAVNTNFFDSKKMNAAMDNAEKSGWHPPRGGKSGLEAVAAHEIGHTLTDVAAQKAGMGAWQLDQVSSKIVRQAAKSQGVKVGELRAKVSGYGKTSNAEAVAEAFADVYCNGKKASAASRAIVGELNKYLKP